MSPGPALAAAASGGGGGGHSSSRKIFNASSSSCDSCFTGYCGSPTSLQRREWGSCSRGQGEHHGGGGSMPMAVMGIGGSGHLGIDGIGEYGGKPSPVHSALLAAAVGIVHWAVPANT